MVEALDIAADDIMTKAILKTSGINYYDEDESFEELQAQDEAKVKEKKFGMHSERWRGREFLFTAVVVGGDDDVVFFLLLLLLLLLLIEFNLCF
jgi:hypothetical protein